MTEEILPDPIGTPGQPWSTADRRQWFTRQTVRRSCAEQVITPVRELESRFEVTQYGALSIDPRRDPLYCVSSPAEAGSAARPAVLVTGGVHGYETSGVHGALRFLATHAQQYTEASALGSCKGVTRAAYVTTTEVYPDRQSVDDETCVRAQVAAVTGGLDFLHPA